MQVTLRHTGAALLEEVYQCTERFGITNLVRAMAFDNLDDYGTFGDHREELQVQERRIFGQTMRESCFAHFTQLVVSALLRPVLALH